MMTVMAGTAVLAAGAAVAAFWSYRSAMKEARDAWVQIASGARQSDNVYSANLVAELPEIAQRYFNHAIAPGTPLKNIVELDMGGTFLLGDRSSYQTYSMEARQILHPSGHLECAPEQCGYRVLTHSSPAPPGPASGFTA
jgi:hypothetical protein